MGKTLLNRNRENFPTRLMHQWAAHRRSILICAIAIMALGTVASFGHQFWRLLFDQSARGAIDLKLRHLEVGQFFSGWDISSPYPPASFVILWPLLGWLTVDAARWLWAALYAVTGAWLASCLVRESRAEGRLEILFVALCFLSMNATGQTIGTGQLGIFILAVLVPGLMMVRRNGHQRIGADLIAATLILLALVKPSYSAPFFWIALFSIRMRPALLVLLGYVSLTAVATLYQQADIVELFRTWADTSARLGAAADKGSANLHSYIPQDFGTVIGLSNTDISLVLLVLLGIWVFYYRRVDLWILLGVTGIFARIWTYHRLYDDVLIILPMIALFRLLKNDSFSTVERVFVGNLLAASVLVNLVPARIQHRWPGPWPEIHSTVQLTIWFVMLGVLVLAAIRAKRQPVGKRDLDTV